MAEEWMTKVGVLTISDSCSKKEAEDKSGPALKIILNDGKILPGAVVTEADLVPDDEAVIREKLLDWCDNKKLDFIITTGGTGFSKRDVTPEATKSVIEKMAPGMMTAMTERSLQVSPMAMLSRAVCGSRGKTLIVNTPGSEKASVECLGFLAPALPHAIDLLNDRKKHIIATHKALQGGGEGLSVSSKSQGHSHVHHEHVCMHDHHQNLHDHHQNQHHGDKDHSHQSAVDASKVARRPRESPYPLISVKEATDIVFEEAYWASYDSGTEIVSLPNSLRRILADDIFAKDALPPFPASIKDGYAVVAADGIGNRLVLSDSTAGDMPKSEVMPGYCVRINTGAPLPVGADAVVQVEDTELVRDSDQGEIELEIKILTVPKVGQDIRPVGFDIALNEKVLVKGQRIGPSEIGILASVGVTDIPVYTRPIVGVMSTGNELFDPDHKLAPGKIRDSNRSMLLAALAEHGFPSIDLGIGKDDPSSLKVMISNAIDKVDIIVTTGGVSMGEKDLLKQVLHVDFGVQLKFGRVFMKPGKPTTFGTMNTKRGKLLFFGLPGNPVSAIVTFNLYVLPAIRKLAQYPDPANRVIKAKVTADIKLDPRPEYYRVALSWEDNEPIPSGYGTGSQISSRLLSCKLANALLVLPPSKEEKRTVSAGEIVDAIVIGPIM